VLTFLDLVIRFASTLHTGWLLSEKQSLRY
jgi:hypothetical protein